MNRTKLAVAIAATTIVIAIGYASLRVSRRDSASRDGMADNGAHVSAHEHLRSNLLLPPGWTDLPMGGPALAKELKKPEWRCEPGEIGKGTLVDCKSCRSSALPFTCAELTATDGPSIGDHEDGVFDHLFLVSFALSPEAKRDEAVSSLLSAWGDPDAVAGAVMWGACWRGTTWTTSLLIDVLRGASFGGVRLMLSKADVDPCMAKGAVTRAPSASSFDCTDPTTDYLSSLEHLRRCGTGTAAYYFASKDGLYYLLFTCDNGQCSTTQFTDETTGGQDQIISDRELTGRVQDGVIDLRHEIAVGASRPVTIAERWTFSTGGLIASMTEENDMPDESGHFTKTSAQDHGTLIDCSTNAMCASLVADFGPSRSPKPEHDDRRNRSMAITENGHGDHRNRASRPPKPVMAIA